MAKSKAGRPRLENRRIIMTITMSFDPLEDSDILAVLYNAPKGDRAKVALALMRGGIGTVGGQIKTPTVSVEVIESEVSMDDDGSFL